MAPRLAYIAFLDEINYPDNTLPGQQPGTKPPWAGGPGGPTPPYPDAGLPPFPSHPIVVPPGGSWPGLPGRPPYPDNSLPAFPSHPIVVPPGGNWPTPPTPPGGPSGPVYPMPPSVGTPIELVAVFVPGVGYVIVPKSALPPTTPPTQPPHPDNTLPTPPVDPNAPIINPL